MLLTAKKAPGSSPPSPDRRESPRPGYFVVLVVFFFFFPADFDVSFPQRNADLPAGARHGDRLSRPPLVPGTAFLPFLEREKERGKKKKREYKKGGRDSPGVRAFPRPRSRPGPPSAEPRRPASSHADASPGPRRPAPHDRWKNGTRKRDCFNGKTSTNNVKLSMDGGRIV